MIKFELLLNEDRVTDVKELLTKIGIKKLTLIEVKEYDEEHIYTENYRGATVVIEFHKKIKLEILLESTELINQAIDAINQANIEVEILVYEVLKSIHLNQKTERTTQKKNAFDFDSSVYSK